MAEELKGVGEAIRAMVRQVEARWRSTRGGRAVDYATIERQGAAGAAALERARHQAVLQGLEVDQPRGGMEGKGDSRDGRDEADYYTRAGPVRLTRTLDREQGQRNAKPVTAVSLRSGAVAEGWLPATAQALAQHLPQGTAREAETRAPLLGRLPSARSSCERVGQEVGGR